MSNSPMRPNLSVVQAAKKSLLAMAVLSGITLSNAAMAADDSSLTWNGITFYGVYDISVTHQTKSAPVSSDWVNGTNWMISKGSYKAITAVAPGALSNSLLGLRGKEGINDDLSFVFDAQIGFNPQSGKLNDGPLSLINNNGLPITSTHAASDSPRAGQLFNGALYGGLSSKDWGTLTFGRNASWNNTVISTYDPIGGSKGFSLFGFSGSLSGGGDTEDGFLDGSLKYAYKNDWFHAGLLYQPNGVDGSPGIAAQGEVGINYEGFAADAAYAKKNSALALSSASAAQIAAHGQNVLAATVSDNKDWVIGASWTGGPLKISGGYTRIQIGNTGLSTKTPPAGFDGLGGYFVIPVGTNNPKTKVLDVDWIGLKYALSSALSVSGAWYHESQNTFNPTACATSKTSATTAFASSCAGDENVFSVLLDYKLSKRADVYAGAAYSKVEDGLASGFFNIVASNKSPAASNFGPTVGFRFQF